MIRLSTVRFGRSIDWVAPNVARQSVTAKVVAGNAGDQEKPIASSAATYLQLFGLAQSTNPSSFDLENRLLAASDGPGLCAWCSGRSGNKPCATS